MANPPIIYELNAWVWLNQLSAKYNRQVRLDSIPFGEWDRLAVLGIDTVWLMGAWMRSPAARQIALSLPDLVQTFKRALPDFTPADVCGSPYAIQNYVVDPFFGGPEALAAARGELTRRNLRLILDFVPNHVAPDHPWLAEHPEYLIQSPADSSPDPAYFFKSGERTFAHGRDPYFPAWTDTVQVNAFCPELRSGAAQVLRSIAAQCDGVRCDMAMLLLNDIFARTWGDLAGTPPQTEYWTDIISQVRAASPHFLFIAEAYWDLEERLQQLGFDFCYDKRLYDALLHSDAQSVEARLAAPAAYQNKLVRFLENHDEPRVSAVVPEPRHRAAAVAIATLPGGKLYHQDQFSGARIQTPVHLARHADEEPDFGLETFYLQLLHETRHIPSNSSDWRLCDRFGWSDNQSFRNILAWSCIGADATHWIVINFGDMPAQARVHFPLDRVDATDILLSDPLNDRQFRRDVAELDSEGLFVSLDGWSFHLFRVAVATSSDAR